MPRRDYKTCRRCGRSTREVGPLSWTRQCADCGDARLQENIVGIHTHTGPAFERWRFGMVASALDPAYVSALVAAGILEPVE